MSYFPKVFVVEIYYSFMNVRKKENVLFSTYDDAYSYIQTRNFEKKSYYVIFATIHECHLNNSTDVIDNVMKYGGMKKIEIPKKL